MLAGLALEFLQTFGIVATHPAGGRHRHRLKQAFDIVFILEALGNHVKLQNTHRPQNKIVVAQGTEQLRRPLLTQLFQALV